MSTLEQLEAEYRDKKADAVREREKLEQMRAEFTEQGRLVSSLEADVSNLKDAIADVPDGCMRCEQEGWEEICLPDGRRGLWMRETPRLDDSVLYRDKVPTRIELCSGREGDDGYVSLTLGETISEQLMARLYSAMLDVAFATGLADDEDEVPRIVRSLRVLLEWIGQKRTQHIKDLVDDLRQLKDEPPYQLDGRRHYIAMAISLLERAVR